MFRKLIIRYGVLPAEVMSHTAADGHGEDGKRQLNPAFGSVCGLFNARLGNADSAGLMRMNTPLKDDPESVNINTTFLLHLS